MSNIPNNTTGVENHTQESNISYFINRSGFQLFCNFSIKNSDDRKIWMIVQAWPPHLYTICDFLHDNLSANTFKFEYTGLENSEGERIFGSYRRDADDIDDAVKFLISRGYEVEGIIGIAETAPSLFVYSALYGQIKKIISLSARFHMNALPDIIKDIYEVLKQEKTVFHTAFGVQWKYTLEMVEEYMNTDMKLYCERSQGDFYIIHGDNDEYCPYIDSLEYVKVLKEKCKGHFTLGCDHLYFGVFDEVIEIVQNIISGN